MIDDKAFMYTCRFYSCLLILIDLSIVIVISDKLTDSDRLIVCIWFLMSIFSSISFTCFPKLSLFIIRLVVCFFNIIATFFYCEKLEFFSMLFLMLNLIPTLFLFAIIGITCILLVKFIRLVI